MPNDLSMAAARFASANELKIPTTLSMIQSSPPKLLARTVPRFMLRDGANGKVISTQSWIQSLSR
jgi:hypothetical protein